jgi:hypothetical protein
MTEEIEAPYGWMNWDVFRTDQDSFERDAHILILGTLHAGATYLNTEAQKEEDDLVPHLKIVKGQQRVAVEDKSFNLSNHPSPQLIGQAVDAYRAVCAWLRRRLSQLIVDSLYVETPAHRLQEVSILE